MTRLLISFVTALTIPVAACGSGATGTKPPPAPANGAPIAFIVESFTPGQRFDGKVKVKGYNFSDAHLAGYSVAARFTDQAGAQLKVGVGTAFEKDVAWTSMSGRRFECKAKSWCAFEIASIEVPAATAKAEVMLTSATAVSTDGVSFEKDDFWKSPNGTMAWPE